MKLILLEQEVSLLREALEHEGSKESLFIDKFLDGKFYIIGEEEAFIFYQEICENYLLFNGFDENYNITSNGKILEQLIDKFFDSIEKNTSE